jgi:8-oxo-dGTP pyrophosphatase MutT (NUDIX family)
MQDVFIQNLTNRLSEPLPGRPAQFRMASMKRLAELGNFTVPADAKVACVLNLLHFSGGEWRTVLIQRTINPRDRHSGQVSFPGGRYEEGDGNLSNVALREAEEEVGVSPEQIRILGRLTELYIPVSNFLVHPFVGMLQGNAVFTPQPGEVEAILTPTLSHFLRPDTQKQTDLNLTHHAAPRQLPYFEAEGHPATNITLREVPYFEVEGRVVWGATAMILSEFVEILASSPDLHTAPNPS